MESARKLVKEKTSLKNDKSNSIFHFSYNQVGVFRNIFRTRRSMLLRASIGRAALQLGVRAVSLLLVGAPRIKRER